MKIIRILLIAVALLAVVFAAGLGIAWIRTAPEGLPPGSESAARLAPGPYPVGNVELDWVDGSRPTAENGEHPGSPERRFSVALWYPEGVGPPAAGGVVCHDFHDTAGPMEHGPRGDRALIPACTALLETPACQEVASPAPAARAHEPTRPAGLA